MRALHVDGERYSSTTVTSVIIFEDVFHGGVLIGERVPRPSAGVLLRGEILRSVRVLRVVNCGVSGDASFPWTGWLGMCVSSSINSTGLGITSPTHSQCTQPEGLSNE